MSALPSARWPRAFVVPALLGIGLSAAPDARAADDTPQTLAPLAEEGVVTVKDFRLTPMSHIVADARAWEFHPKALLGVGYDSNIDATPSDRVDDGFYEAIIGGEARYAIDDNHGLTASLELGRRDYFSQRHRGGFTARAKSTYVWVQSPVTTHQLFVNYARQIDPLAETGRPSSNSNLNARLESNHAAWRNQLGSRLLYSHEAYYDNDGFSTPHERDNSRFAASGSIGHYTGSDSELILRADIDRVDYVGHGRYQDSDGVAVTLGWQVTPSPRVAINIDGGAQWRWYSDCFNHDPAYDDRTVIAPIAETTIRWEPEDKSYLLARAFASIDQSSIANAYTVQGLALTGKMRLLINASLQAVVQVRHLEASGAPAGARREERDVFETSLTGEYLLRDGLGIRVIDTYETSDSLTANDYRRFTTRVELGIAY